MNLGLSDDRLSNPSKNCLGVLRLGLALLVIFSHGFRLGEFGSDPFLLFSRGIVTFGGFAVHGFFILSGFLVAQSWARLGRPGVYLAHRILRIMPAYWLCLILTVFLFGPLLAILIKVSGSYWQSLPSPWCYLMANSILLQKQGDIGQLTAGQEVSGFLNMSQWTLPWEFLCYLGVLFLGVTGLVKQRSRWVIAGFFIFYANLNIDPTHYRFFFKLYTTELATPLPVFFLGGCVLWSWRRLVCESRWGMVLLFAAFLVGTGLGFYRWCGPVLLPPLFLGAARLFCSPQFILKNDYSYGTYLYGALVQRVLVATGIPLLNPWLFFALATVFTLPLAVLSWNLLEKPALQFAKKIGH
jgi:peptidoglycan/LPS O-acetylase OafA/YrhL